METESSDGIRLGKRVVVRRAAPALAEVIILPSDAKGTPGRLNGEILKSLGLDPKALPNQRQLAPGYHVDVHSSFKLCFVVTVGNGLTETNLSNNLARALQDKQIIGANTIWIPLMGTGAGRLRLADSLRLTVDALLHSEWAWDYADTIISIPNQFTDGTEELADTIEELRHSLTGDIADSDWPAPISAAMESLFSFALALRNPSHIAGLTTELLLFALSDANADGLPSALSLDRSALFFSTAIKELAGPDFQTAWSSFFRRNWSAPPAHFPPAVPLMTKNVRLLLLEAQKNATAKNRNVTNIDDFVRALLNFQEGEWLSYLQAMKVNKADLLIEYEDLKAGQVMMTLHNDVAGAKDNLGYQNYADAIAKFLLNAETPPPLSISIQAPWGAGKSSLMHMIRERIDPKVERELHIARYGSKSDVERLKLGSVLTFLNREPDPKTKKPHDTSLPMITSLGQSGGRLITIWFNAWMYETSEQIWAGLVDAIVSQISERLAFRQREAFLLRLQLARIDDTIVRRKIYNRIVTIWWARVQRWVLLGVSAFAGLIGIGGASEALPAALREAVAPLTKFGFSGAVIAQIILSAYLVYAYFDSKKKTTDEPAKFSLADYIKVPDYDKSVGQIHQIHADLRHVLAVTPKDEGSHEHSPIVIFIDDLDRCSPNKVASVVEGVNMLLAMEAYRCMFVIGMDPQMIAAALEKAHEDVRKQLPSYERSAPLGWRFMDKFVQLPFTIPPSRRENIEEFLVSLGAAAPSRASRDLSNAATVTVPLPPSSSTNASLARPEVNADERPLIAPSETPRSEIAAESRDVGRIIRRVSAYSIGNPREVKRMVNLARLYLALRNERRNRDPNWRSPDFDHYARWIALSLRWPDMMRWLQWGADAVSWKLADNDQTLIARRLKKLEDATLGAEADVKQWAAEIAKQLYVDQDTTVRWTLDPKLFEFFQIEAQRPLHERLSRVAIGGFW